MVSVIQARVSPEIEFKALPYFSGLAHTCQLLFENGDFFLWFSLPSILVWSKRSPKTHLFKNVFQSGDFWKPLFAALVWMDEISRLRHGGSDTILRCAYSHQRWYRLESQERQNDSTQRVDENVFENGKKFSNKNGYPHMCGQCLSLLQVFNTG